MVANLVDRRDVGMIERTRGARLPQEAGRRVAVTHRSRRQELQRDAALECGVFGQVNRAHAASAEMADDSVVGDEGAHHDWPRTKSEAYRGAAEHLAHGRSQVSGRSNGEARPILHGLAGCARILTRLATD